MEQITTVLGIDGGGTKTVSLLAAKNGKILGLGIGGPLNEKFVNELQARQSLRDSLKAAMSQVKSPIAIEVVYVSAPGLTYGVLHSALGERIGSAKVYLEDDVLASFRGALPNDRGVVVLAGTGSFAVARDGKGAQAITGGWGPLLGDEGSGYALGLEVLRTVIRSGEGREAPTCLTELLQNELQYRNKQELIEQVYSHMSRQEIAALAMLVSKAVAMQDAVAEKMMSRAGRELALLGVGAAKKLDFSGDEFLFTLTGGIAKAGEALLTSFQTELRHRAPTGKYVPPLAEPIFGTLLLALEKSGIKINDQLIRNLSTGYTEWRERMTYEYS
jgi:N-acetylmuramic acid 6-phosphate etherase